MEDFHIFRSVYLIEWLDFLASCVMD